MDDLLPMYNLEKGDTAIIKKPLAVDNGVHPKYKGRKYTVHEKHKMSDYTGTIEGSSYRLWSVFPEQLEQDFEHIIRKNYKV